MYFKKIHVNIFPHKFCGKLKYINSSITQKKIIFHKFHGNQISTVVYRDKLVKGTIFMSICRKLNSTEIMDLKFLLEFSLPGVEGG